MSFRILSLGVVVYDMYFAVYSFFSAKLIKIPKIWA